MYLNQQLWFIELMIHQNNIYGDSQIRMVIPWFIYTYHEKYLISGDTS